ncbi:hypothetical protein MRX96_028241 [Rhipicephalus microplus]
MLLTSADTWDENEGRLYSACVFRVGSRKPWRALGEPETQVVDPRGPLPCRLVLERDEEVVGRRSNCSIRVRSSHCVKAPRHLQTRRNGERDSGNEVSNRSAAPTADEGESDSSPAWSPDGDNNKVLQHAESPNRFAMVGRSDAFSEHSKTRLSLCNNAVRKVESIMENELTCAICSELFVEAAMLQCGHTFCSYCIHHWRKQKNMCPFCLTAISSVTRSFIVDNIIDELVCFKPELKRVREAVARSRSAASKGHPSKH